VHAKVGIVFFVESSEVNGIDQTAFIALGTDEFYVTGPNYFIKTNGLLQFT
jgi:hypothetical protein